MMTGIHANLDHPITIEPWENGARALAGGVVVAQSRAPLVLREADYPPVIYFPRADARMARFVESTRVTHCPFKGDATHYSIVAGEDLIADAAWSYRAPLPAVAAIRDHIAFYPAAVRIIGGPP